jgi:hypothetical protein
MELDIRPEALDRRRWYDAEAARVARWLRATTPYPWRDQPNLAVARTSPRPGVDHSSTTRILDAFRYQTRWV